MHPTVPPRVDYELTAMGATLHETIRALVTWTEAHQNQIATARAAYDAGRRRAGGDERRPPIGRPSPAVLAGTLR